MTLAATAQPAPAGARGFDANTPLNAAAAREFWDAGFRFVLRYVGRDAMASHDLSTAEAELLLAQGFGLMPVQHVLEPGWKPTGSLGTEYGANAARFAQQIGIPAGVSLWLDLEGVSTDSQAPDVVAYCNNWYGQVAAAGYVPGVYIGWHPGLTGEQLYSKLSFKHYWAAYNVDGVSTPHPRGYQMIQSCGTGTVGGITTDAYDVDTTAADGMGGVPLWLKR
jgi:hypothetical protein